MKKRFLTHRLKNSQMTQMALFPIKLMAVLLSMVVLFVSLPLSAMSIPNGNGMTDGGESGNSSGNEKPSVALPFFDIPEVVSLSDLEERSISGRMRDEEQSLCDIVFANDDGSRTSFLYGTPVKYISIDETVRDKSFYIADLTAEPENGYVGRMEAELAASVASHSFLKLSNIRYYPAR